MGYEDETNMKKGVQLIASSDELGISSEAVRSRLCWRSQKIGTRRSMLQLAGEARVMGAWYGEGVGAS